MHNHYFQISRGNQTARVLINESYYYSVLDEGTVDLNFESQAVIDELKVRFFLIVAMHFQLVTQHWLDLGVDGILLSDAAFYVETTLSNGTNWFYPYPESQLYNNGSVDVVRQIRTVIDQKSVSTKTKK